MGYMPPAMRSGKMFHFFNRCRRVEYREYSTRPALETRRLGTTGIGSLFTGCRRRLRLRTAVAEPVEEPFPNRI